MNPAPGVSAPLAIRLPQERVARLREAHDRVQIPTTPFQLLHHFRGKSTRSHIIQLHGETRPLSEKHRKLLLGFDLLILRIIPHLLSELVRAKRSGQHFGLSDIKLIPDFPDHIDFLIENPILDPLQECPEVCFG